MNVTRNFALIALITTLAMPLSSTAFGQVFGGGISFGSGHGAHASVSFSKGIRSRQAPQECPPAAGNARDSGHQEARPRRRTGGLAGALGRISVAINGTQERGPRASSRDPKTGVTTTSCGNRDGSRTVTRTDRNGKVIGSKVIPKKRLPSASSRDPRTGVTTTSRGNRNGSRTVTRTDRNGKVIGSKVIPKKSLPSASSRDSCTGVTTTSRGNRDGSRTITRTDRNGGVIDVRRRPRNR